MKKKTKLTAVQKNWIIHQIIVLIIIFCFIGKMPITGIACWICFSITSALKLFRKMK